MTKNNERAIVGLDIGNGYTKICNADGCHRFASVLAPAVDLGFQFETVRNREDYLLLEYRGAQFVGEFAVEFNPHATRQAFGRGRNIGDVKSLMLAALSRVVLPGERHVYLAAGVPVAWYVDAERIKSELSGRYEYHVNGQPYKIQVDCDTVLPQPAGSMIAASYAPSGHVLFNGLVESKTLVVDIGQCTTDYAVFAGVGSYRAAQSGTVEVGMQNALHALADAVEREHARSLTVADAECAVRIGHVLVRGTEHNVAPLVDSALQTVAGPALARAREIYGDGRDFEAVLLCGGGAQPLERAFRQAFGRQLLLASEPGLSNARGFYTFALLKWLSDC